MWVELTGKPSCEAISTVIAAARAMQKARVRSSSVISEPTVRISLGPYSARPSEMPSAPTSITHNGIEAFCDTAPPTIASLMPARGPTALADVVGAVREAEQGGGEDQGDGEQLVHGVLIVRQPLRRPLHQRLDEQIDGDGSAEPVQRGEPKRNLPDVLQPLQQQIGAEMPMP